MNFNTFLLEVSPYIRAGRKPNLEQRAQHIAEWFASLDPELLPDVLVLNEVYSYAAERMLRTMACKKWSKNRPLGCGVRNFLACDPDSKFEAVTRDLNATWLVNPIKEGGIVILTKRGITMRSAHEQVFAAASGSDALSRKGFWAVEVLKGSQAYWVLGTHVQAHSSPDKARVRAAQFRQMRQFAERAVPSGGRVCFVGDLNTTMPGEVAEMLDAFGAPGTPATVGDLVPRGFWLPLDEDLLISSDVDRNHFNAGERKKNSHCLDWVISPGANDRFATPAALRYQYIPVKGSSYMPSDLIRGTECDDLSDHNAVFAQLWYGGEPCPELPSVTGHRGVAGRLPCDLPQQVLAALGKCTATDVDAKGAGASDKSGVPFDLSL